MHRYDVCVCLFMWASFDSTEIIHFSLGSCAVPCFWQNGHSNYVHCYLPTLGSHCSKPSKTGRLQLTHLWGCIKAHEAHTEVDGQTHEVAVHDAGICFTLQLKKSNNVTHEHFQSNPCALFDIHNADLDSLHLQEGGHLKGFFPDQQLTFQLHTEEHVLPCLRLDAEAVLPLVQKVIVLRSESRKDQTQ